MEPQSSQQAEQERIAHVYRSWHGGVALARYAWHRPEILQQVAARARGFADLLSNTVGADLARLQVLDVGCGTGGFLRQMIDWGVTPGKLTGTELQNDRLEHARRCTAHGVHWHLGTLDALPQAGYDLVTAQTVFSSVLDPGLRGELAAQMWRAAARAAGVWCSIFAMTIHATAMRARSRAPSCMVGGRESARYRSLMPAPPIHRPLAGAPHIVSELLTACAPLLRSHFMYVVKKPGAVRPHA